MTKDGIVTMDDYESEWDEEPLGYAIAHSPDYYDLIELPNGRHVPVPIARGLLGGAIIDAIPVSKKVRDSQFFYCVQCDQYQTMIDKLCHPQELIMPLENGHSFFRCKQHKPTTDEENAQKEAMLVRLVLNGMYRSLRYVEAKV